VHESGYGGITAVVTEFAGDLNYFCLQAAITL